MTSSQTSSIYSHSFTIFSRNAKYVSDTFVNSQILNRLLQNTFINYTFAKVFARLM